jgi:hypothetical protein
MTSARKSQTAKRKRYPIRELLAFNQAGARLVIVDGEGFILNGKEHRHISRPSLLVLLEENWITQPSRVTDDLALSSLTSLGRAKAKALEAARRAYTQLEFSLCDESFSDE